MLLTCQADRSSDLFNLTRYLLLSSNRFYRLLRAEGIFLRGPGCAAAKAAGMEMDASWIYLVHESVSRGCFRTLGIANVERGHEAVSL